MRKRGRDFYQQIRTPGNLVLSSFFVPYVPSDVLLKDELQLLSKAEVQGFMLPQISVQV